MTAFSKLDLNKRMQIQSFLSEGLSLSAIARKIGVTTSTVSREIRHFRVEDGRPGRFSRNSCAFRKECKRCNLCAAMETTCRRRGKSCAHCRSINCNTVCKDYRKEVCPKPDRPPYVCNHCNEFIHGKCPLTKYFYKAAEAQEAARTLRSSSRSGLNLTEQEIHEADVLLSPRIRKGQSIHHIMVSEPEVFNFSERQAYILVNAGLISARPIDMPRTVRMRPRKRKSVEKKVDRSCRIGRTYDDFLRYMDKHPDEPVLEGDTVEGVKGGKCILTLTWRQWSFQIGFLRDHNNSESVTQIINSLYESLGCDKFRQVFPSVWLFDNGSEFSDPKEIEKFGVLVFYCDPSSPYQKGCCEVTHEYVRRILPKGTSFDDLDQGFIDYMYSHINSERRKKLNNLSPFEAFSSVLGKDVIEKYFCIRWIDPRFVQLNQSLKSTWLFCEKEEN